MVLDRRDPLVISRPHYMESFDCGYCHCKKPSKSADALSFPPEANIPQKPTHITIGCSVQQMTCRDYDEFMNMGFRRSGNFLYKGDMLRGCCRMYTIRTQLSQMKISKEHRQTVNRFKRAILDVKEEAIAENNRSRTNDGFELTSLIEAEQASSRFYTRFEPAKFSEEKFALYKKYQISVHNDKPRDVTPSSFKNFLCQSPFIDHEIEGSEREWNELNTWVKTWGKNIDNSRRVQRVGPLHECYFLDGKLIAISVMDFLPTGVSSVYLIWDPEYAHLSLGTLSAIREVQMCEQLNLGYYYLGYYIEDCDKMRYKKKFGGEVLDVCNEVYVPLENVRPMMVEDNFWVISEKANESESESESESLTRSQTFLETEPQLKREMKQNEEMKLQSEFEIDDCEHEYELSLSGQPEKWNNNLVNAAANIYRNKETYDAAKTVQAILKAKLSLSASELPLVLPGAIPLYQILSWVEDKAIDGGLPCSVFDTRTGKLHECSIDMLGVRERNYVMDFLRLFGLERTQESIIII